MGTNLSHYLRILLLIAIGVSVHQCDEPPVSFSYYDNPDSKRQNQLVIFAHDIVGEPLNEVNVTIDGPITLSATAPKGEFSYDGLVAGTYQVEVRKPGYVGYRSLLAVAYPEGVFSEIQLQMEAQLIALEAPKAVNTIDGEVFRGGFSHKQGFESMPTELNVQPGSLASGSQLNLSITRVPGMNAFGSIVTSGNFTVIDILGMNISSVTLFKPAVWNIPLQLSNSLKAIRPLFWLIPVDWNPESGYYDLKGSPTLGSVDPGYNFATFPLTTLQSYALVTDLGLRLTTSTSKPVQISRSSCGLKSDVLYRTDSGSATPSFLSINPYLPSKPKEIIAKRSYSGVDRHRVVVQASHVEQRWQILHPTTKAVIDQIDVKSGPVRFDLIQQRCLDSGGS